TLTINLTPNAINIPPVAEDDSFALSEGGSVSGNVITNLAGADSDGGDGAALSVTQINGQPLAFDATTGDATFTIIDGVFNALTPTEILALDDSIFIGTNDNGILTINAAGDFTYESKGFLAGSDHPTFVYTLSDGTDTDTARVTITVETNAPVANDDSSGFDFSPDKTITVQGNVSGLGRGSSGDVRDNFGADGSGSPAVTQVEYMGVVYSLGVSNSSGNPIEIVTDFGSLFIDNMGTYQFVEKDGLTLEEITADDIPTNSDGNLALDFTYTIQDGDTLNSETSSADLVIEIRVPAVTPDTLSHDINFDKTSGTIDTGSASKARIVVDDASKDESPETDNLSDILVDAQSDGLEKYLTMMMGEDEGSKDNTELSAALKDFQVDDAIVLKKGEVEAEPVTNGLLADGAIIISDAAAANSVPIAELDSSELL
ncbi:MAG: hypothetical protein JKY14_04670, partial [Paraglaciecola sp.]|nr:hypothetical protein [Paraglaciecola sp.]